ncbi:GNAT family N-acetyltransferase [Paenibacillus donghaensis]|uniref:GNAT family N-acetyltransferase n=1 Tax=Paenibacillus donghaensis TaxID=414771 RepID=UPI0018831BE0|nr:GNAT family N-acetyltransferase [Paenibacillus donghaensis]MBE9915015.1 GNAT family N-acetyltransferase [Paenibacillus donghaensis]
MEHIKRYHAKSLQYQNRLIVVEGPVSPEQLRVMRMHPELNAFRHPQDQKQALEEIARLLEGRIILARDGQTIVGYVTFHYPDEQSPWSERNMDDLIEFGAIEVAGSYRMLGLGKEMMLLSFEGGQMEDAIVFATEYYEYWDIHNSKLSAWDYRRMTEQLLKHVDMFRYDTDDPEICSHPANCLMVRIGKDVPLSSIEKFDRMRFRRSFLY